MRAPADRLLCAGILAFSVVLGGGVLRGAPSEISPPVPLTFAAWRSFALERAVEQVASVRVARHAPFVKAYNQVLYSVLGATSAEQQFVIGRSGQFYGKFSVQEYCDSWPALGTRDSDLRDFASESAELARRLRARGRAFMVVTTPSKSATLPAGLPRFQCAREAPNRVLPRLVAKLREASVPLADGAALARQVVRESSVPIFPRYGIHWNEWGAYPAVVEMLRLGAAELGEPPPRLGALRVTFEDEPIEVTEEREERMDLYACPRERRVPRVRFEIGPGGVRLRATLVGDSFSEAMITLLDGVRAYGAMERFNYLTEFHTSHPSGVLRGENLKLDDIDWEKDIFASNVVVLEINEMLGLPDFARTFVREALARLSPSRTVEGRSPPASARTTESGHDSGAIGNQDPRRIR
jgi:hypothetical protein